MDSPEPGVTFVCLPEGTIAVVAARAPRLELKHVYETAAKSAAVTSAGRHATGRKVC
jgi:hypothetical protein